MHALYECMHASLLTLSQSETGENERFPRSTAALFLARAVGVFAGCLSILIARAPWNAAGVVTAVAYGGVLL